MLLLFNFLFLRSPTSPTENHQIPKIKTPVKSMANIQIKHITPPKQIGRQESVQKTTENLISWIIYQASSMIQQSPSFTPMRDQNTYRT